MRRSALVITIGVVVLVALALLGAALDAGRRLRRLVPTSAAG
jgi:hypothetical protein